MSLSLFLEQTGSTTESVAIFRKSLFMQHIYFCSLILISLLIFLWGIQKNERIYQFPFVINAIYISFIIPQCLSIQVSPGSVLTEKMIERYFLMACLCLLMSWFGYNQEVNQNFLRLKYFFRFSPSYEKLINVGVVFIIIACVADFGLAFVPMERMLTGPATILIFFRRWIFYGFSILLIVALSTKNKSVKLLLFIAISVVLIISIVADGRREPTITFLLILGSILYFIHRIKVPRIIPIIAIVGILFINPLIGPIRAAITLNNYDEILNTNYIEFVSNYYLNYQKTANEGDLLEVRNGALYMDATEDSWEYGFGTSYYDALIKYYVPGQIFGKDWKQSLKFNWTDIRDIEKKYNYKYYDGQTYTGIADVFVEFDYMGCIIFFLLAYFYKVIWSIAREREMFLAQFSYAILIAPTMIIITHGSQRYLKDIVILLIIVFLIKRFCREKGSNLA